LLESGKHFDSPFVCNYDSEEDIFRLIDGNHRLAAIESFLEDNPGRRVEVGICLYTDLDEDTEKEVFTKWNQGTKQNTNDFIKQYWDNIPITKWMKKPYFPCRVKHCWAAGGIELKLLLSPYIMKDFTGESQISFQGSSVEFIHKAMKLTKEDHNILNEFMIEYIGMFGNPDKVNPMYRNCTFMAAMRIWLKNYQKFNPEVLRKRMLRLRGHERVMYWATQGAGRANTIQCLRDLLDVINSSIRRQENLFI